MIEAAPAVDARPSSYPRLKVLYLLAVTVLVFAIPAWDVTRPARWIVIPALLGLQVALLLFARVSPFDIVRSAFRLKWLFLFLIACYVFLPPESADSDEVYYWQPPFGSRSIPLNLSGFETAIMMCSQIVTVVMVSAAVRLSGSSTDLVEGLRKFRLPNLLALSVDTTLALLGGMNRRGMGRGGGRGGGGGGGGGRRGGGRGGGSGGGSRQVENGDAEPASACAEADLADRDPSPLSAVRHMLRGDVGFFVQAIERSLIRAREQVDQANVHGLDHRLVHDVSVISGIALTMMSLKMLKVLPGLPFIPGWKTVFFYPLYILAAQLTYSRWGGTTAGTIMGVLGYLQGDGRYGALEILKHVTPGLVTDIAWPVVRRLPRSIFIYCLLGLVTAIARTSTEFAVMWLIQVRWEAYAFPVIVVSTNLVAGVLSGVLTYFVLPGFHRVLPAVQADAVATSATVCASNESASSLAVLPGGVAAAVELAVACDPVGGEVDQPEHCDDAGEGRKQGTG